MSDVWEPAYPYSNKNIHVNEQGETVEMKRHADDAFGYAPNLHSRSDRRLNDREENKEHLPKYQEMIEEVDENDNEKKK